MNTKLLTGGLIAAVANFFLGWLIFGMLLKGFYEDHTTETAKAVMRGEENMIWWAIIAGSVLWAFMLAYVLLKAGVNSASRGASIAAVVSILISGAINCYIHAQMDLGDTTTMIVDILANAVVGAILGGIIGWYYGRSNRVINS